MSVVKRKVGREQVGSRRSDAPTAPTEVKDRIVQIKNRSKRLHRLAIKLAAEENRRTVRLGERNRRDRRI